MQVSLTDYAVFERNGTWGHIVKKLTQKHMRLNMKYKVAL